MDERLGISIKRAELAMISAKERALAPFGLTVSQYGTLNVLREHPGAPGAEVARQCMVTPQAITTVLGNLEGRGLVTRRPHPYHRGLREVHLTEAGRRLAEQADSAALAVEARLAQGLTRADLERLQRALRRCADNVEPATDPVPPDPGA